MASAAVLPALETVPLINRAQLKFSSSVFLPTCIVRTNHTQNGGKISYDRYSVDYTYKAGRQTGRNRQRRKKYGQMSVKWRIYAANPTGMFYSAKSEEFGRRQLEYHVDCFEESWLVDRTGKRVSETLTPQIEDRSKINGLVRSVVLVEVTLAQPRFLAPLNSVTIKDGASFEFRCQVVGIPKPSIYWLKNGAYFRPEQYTDVIFDEDPDDWYVLHMSEAFPEDSGVYSCEAVNPVGRTTSEATLIVESYTYIPDREEASMSGESGSRSQSHSVSRSGAGRRSIDETLNDVSSIVDAEGVVSPLDTDGLGDPPKIVIPLRPVVAFEGQMTELLCKVSSTSPYEISWFKDDERIVPTDDIEVLDSPDGLQRVILKEVFADDEGIYTCRIVNGFGPIITQARLTVEVEDFDEDPPAGKHQVLPGDALLPQVTGPVDRAGLANGIPRVNSKGQMVKWHENMIRLNVDPLISDYSASNKIGGANDVISGVPPPPVGILKSPKAPDVPTAPPVPAVASVEPTNLSKKKTLSASSLSTVRSNSGTIMDYDRYTRLRREGRERSVEVSVASPEFVRNLEHIDAVEGERVLFKAIVSGYPMPEITWLVDGDEIRPSKDFNFIFEDGIALLVVSEVLPEDEGEYSCKAANKFGEALSVCFLSVRPKPQLTDSKLKRSPPFAQLSVPSQDLSSCSPDLPIEEPKFILALQDCSVDIGKTARLKCIVTGYPAPTVTWYFNNDPVNPGDVNSANDNTNAASIYEDGVCLLLLRHLTDTQAGEYVCEADNGVGRPTMTRCELLVNNHVLCEQQKGGEMVTSTTTGVSQIPVPIGCSTSPRSKPLETRL